MPVLFFFSITAAAITFTLFYTWCIQKPVLTVSRFFQGQESPEETPRANSTNFRLPFYPLSGTRSRLCCSSVRPTFRLPGGPIVS